MKYLSIDIETTGLDWNKCQMLEFAAVLEDTANLVPVAELPAFHCYILHPELHWEDGAYEMHQHRLLKNYYDRTKGKLYLNPDELIINLLAFCLEHGLDPKRINVAGKNFAGFDLRFIEKFHGYGIKLKFNKRVLDPAILFVDWDSDQQLPDFDVCLNRSGNNTNVIHLALCDALDVITMIRSHIRPFRLTQKRPTLPLPAPTMV